MELTKSFLSLRKLLFVVYRGGGNCQVSTLDEQPLVCHMSTSGIDLDAKAVTRVSFKPALSRPKEREIRGSLLSMHNKNTKIDSYNKCWFTVYGSQFCFSFLQLFNL